jgi:hypothetical protein
VYFKLHSESVIFLLTFGILGAPSEPVPKRTNALLLEASVVSSSRICGIIKRVGNLGLLIDV